MRFIVKGKNQKEKHQSNLNEKYMGKRKKKERVCFTFKKAKSLLFITKGADYDHSKHFYSCFSFWVGTNPNWTPMRPSSTL